MKPLQNLINHIVLIVDMSSSMNSQPVERVIEQQLNSLRERSKQLDQETRVSIYLFNDTVECLLYDTDIVRANLPSGYYKTTGYTALIDATLQGVEEHRSIPQKYGDHAFLAYVVTDGQENKSRNHPANLQAVLNQLPDNWTVGVLVPDSRGEFEAKKFGFPAGCIAVWNTSAHNAFEQVGEQFSKTMDNYMTMRASGTRSTRNLFQMDSSNLRKGRLKPVDFGYQIYVVPQDCPIREFVENVSHRSYAVGSTFYQPTKPVEIQDYKGILVEDVKSGQLYGGENIRELLGLPHQTVKVDPGQHQNWRIFVQSTSTNRKLFAGTRIVVRNPF